MIEILHKTYVLSNGDMIAVDVIGNLKKKNKADHLEINIFSPGKKCLMALHFHL